MNWKKLAVVVLLGLAGGFRSAWAGVPTLGASVTGTTSPTEAAVAKDGNGIVPGNGNHDFGYKVWVTTDAVPHLITDELGNVVTSGLIDKVCVSSGAAAEWLVVYDTNTIASGGVSVTNSAPNAIYAITVPVQRTSAVHTCQTFEAQFNNGAAVLQSGNTLGGMGTVYWRPRKGGRN